MTAETQTHKFTAEVDQVLRLVTHSLYSHKEIFLRELISNAADACDKLRFEAIAKPELLAGDTDFHAYRLGRGTAYALMNTFGTRMAAVFMFVTSTIGLRTGVLARWIPYVGFAFGLVLLFAITEFAWIALVFPLWVLLVSAYILYSDFQEEG